MQKKWSSKRKKTSWKVSFGNQEKVSNENVCLLKSFKGLKVSDKRDRKKKVHYTIFLYGALHKKNTNNFPAFFAILWTVSMQLAGFTRDLLQKELWLRFYWMIYCLLLNCCIFFQHAWIYLKFWYKLCLKVYTSQCSTNLFFLKKTLNAWMNSPTRTDNRSWRKCYFSLENSLSCTSAAMPQKESPDQFP